MFQSCASCGISRPTTESLPRQKLTCSRPPPAVPHNRHRLRRHHHRCGSTRPCTHPANADQLCGQCMSLQPFLCQSLVGHRRCASSSLDDTLEKCDRISQNGIKVCQHGYNVHPSMLGIVHGHVQFAFVSFRQSNWVFVICLPKWTFDNGGLYK